MKLSGLLSKTLGQNKKVSISQEQKRQALKIAGRKGIPQMSTTASKAFRLATDPSSEINDFITLIKSDEATTARIIRISNSVYFDRGNQTANIEDAATRIGLAELKSLFSASALQSMFTSNSDVRRQLWDHNVMVAIAAREIASKIKPELEPTAFTAGLVHDIGKLFFDEINKYWFTHKISDEEELSNEDRERDYFGLSHTEIGLYLGEIWQFPDEILRCIKLHHQYNLITYNKEWDLLKIITIANALINSFYRSPDNYPDESKKDSYRLLVSLSCGEEKRLLETIQNIDPAKFREESVKYN